VSEIPKALAIGAVTAGGLLGAIHPGTGADESPIIDESQLSLAAYAYPASSNAIDIESYQIKAQDVGDIPKGLTPNDTGSLVEDPGGEMGKLLGGTGL
jgi:hypothetical protein